VSFEIDAYDPSVPLIIDPIISYSTYLGGSDSDEALGIAVHSDGSVVVVGETSSVDFPRVNTTYPEFRGDYDGFVTRLNPAGNEIIYSTYVGSEGKDSCRSVVLDAEGNAYVTGLYNGDMLVVKLSPTGSEIWGFADGGARLDEGYAIALGPQGRIFVAGSTESVDHEGTPENEGFPIYPPNAIQTVRKGSGDAFICRILPNGMGYEYSTYLGGTQDLSTEIARGLAVDPTGIAYVVGETFSADFPTTPNAFQQSYGGWINDAFLSKINPSGTQLLYSTLLGGVGYDAAYAVAINGNGHAFIAGNTDSHDFPVTPGAFQPDIAYGDCNPDPFVFRQCSDGFLARVDTSAAGAASLMTSTYFGGPYADFARAVALDALGHPIIAGQVVWQAFHLKDSLRPAGSGWEGYVSKFNLLANALEFSTLLGGGSSDYANAMALDSANNIYLAGRTNSADFPTVNPFQGTRNGASFDAYVLKINMSTPSPWGDVDGNGIFDIQDVLLGLRISCGLAGPGAGQAERADVADADGKVSLNDASLLLRRLRGL
jgi:hypothetical protein